MSDLDMRTSGERPISSLPAGTKEKLDTLHGALSGRSCVWINEDLSVEQTSSIGKLCRKIGDFFRSCFKRRDTTLTKVQKSLENLKTEVLSSNNPELKTSYSKAVQAFNNRFTTKRVTELPVEQTTAETPALQESPSYTETFRQRKEEESRQKAKDLERKEFFAKGHAARRIRDDLTIQEAAAERPTTNTNIIEIKLCDSTVTTCVGELAHQDVGGATGRGAIVRPIAQGKGDIFSARSNPIGDSILIVGGEELKRVCNQIPNRDRPFLEGEVVVTGAARTSQPSSLNTQYVLHTVCPRYNRKLSPAENQQTLKKAYINILEKAKNLGIKEIALPSLGTTGGFGFDTQKEIAAGAAAEAIAEFLKNNLTDMKINMVFTNPADASMFTKKLQEYKELEPSESVKSQKELSRYTEEAVSAYKDLMKARGFEITDEKARSDVLRQASFRTVKNAPIAKLEELALRYQEEKEALEIYKQLLSSRGDSKNSKEIVRLFEAEIGKVENLITKRNPPKPPTDPILLKGEAIKELKRLQEEEIAKINSALNAYKENLKKPSAKTSPDEGLKKVTNNSVEIPSDEELRKAINKSVEGIIAMSDNKLNRMQALDEFIREH